MGSRKGRLWAGLCPRGSPHAAWEESRVGVCFEDKQPHPSSDWEPEVASGTETGPGQSAKGRAGSCSSSALRGPILPKGRSRARLVSGLCPEFLMTAYVTMQP